MKEKSIEAMQGVLKEWNSQRKYTWENKRVFANPNPVVDGEVILHVSNSVDCFIKEGQLINTFLLSPYFGTNTLSDAPISDNDQADAYRLRDFLKKFDDEFYSSVEEKVSGEGIQTTDPLFW